MENLISRQINQYLEGIHFLLNGQPGCIKRKSCAIALLNVEKEVRSKFHEKNIEVLVLLDNTKAFNTADHSI